MITRRLKLPRLDTKRAAMILLGLAVLGIVMVLSASMFLRARGVPGFSQRVEPLAMTSVTDRQLVAEFSETGRPVSSAAYEDVFRYLFEGFVRYRSATGSQVDYPGAPSNNGRASDGLEGFARFSPLASAWLTSGRPDQLTIDGQPRSIAALLSEGMLAGTREGSAGYWGRITTGNQRILEAGEIALALWISREQVWQKYTPAQKAQISAWLSQIFDTDVGASNWSLSPLIVHRSLRALGMDVSRFDERAETTWERFKANYRGDGWFFDPPMGFDFYNSWAIHYGTFWLNQIDPDLDPKFIQQTQAEFGAFSKHLFGPHGTPLFGRSVCYRLATPAGLLTAAAFAPDRVAPGQAMRALDAVWQKFVPTGALRNGAVSQGYCSTDLSVVDNYSGPGSCQQGLRALTVAFWLDPKLHLFDTPRVALPVENGDFKIHSDVLAWTVTGTRSDGDVAVTFDDKPEETSVALRRYRWSDHVRELLTNQPHRPDNHPALYGNRRYSTAQPLLACSALAADASAAQQ